MVEKRRWLDVLSYAVVIAGILLVAFPVYLAFVASTQTAEAARSCSRAATSVRAPRSDA
jgi:ABC-type glycerol-3-phosphate transport system permease component